MNTLEYEILSAIDNIETVTMEAEMHVLTALCNEYEKSMMILENYEGDDISCFDIFQESVIMEGETKKQNIIQRFINWIQRMVSIIFDKIKKLWNKLSGKNNVEVEAPINVTGLSNMTSQVCEGKDQFINDMKNKLNELKQNKQKMTIGEIMKIIEEDMKKINDKCKELKKGISNFPDSVLSEDERKQNEQLKSQCQALGVLLKEYQALITAIEPKGDPNILNKLRQLISHAEIKPSGSTGETIQVYPCLYTRTFYRDFCPVPSFCPEVMSPHKNRYLLNLLLRIFNKHIGPESDDNFSYFAEYVGGYYVCGCCCISRNLAEKCQYNFEKQTFADKKGADHEYLKYFQDIVFRLMKIVVCYVIPENLININKLPKFNLQDMLNIYLDYQKEHWLDADTEFIPVKQTATLQIVSD